ncbi:MAG TPA: class D sortase [Candidatus Limnocylindria bacterium]|nr:class D sortase [Candidatus Limnocylindria bacterium]
MTRLRIASTKLERLLLMVALVSIGFWVGSAADRWSFQLQGARRLDAALDAAMSWVGSDPVAAATRAEVRKSGLIGRIEIPRLGIRAIVAEGVANRTLDRAVGHLPATALPGENGNVGLAGHRDTFFRKLSGVRAGDRIRMTTPDGVFRYRVESVRIVKPDRTDLLHADGASRLTLVTCYPFRWLGSAPKRFVVTAKQVTWADGAVDRISLTSSPGSASSPRGSRSRQTS